MSGNEPGKGPMSFLPRSTQQSVKIAKEGLNFRRYLLKNLSLTRELKPQIDALNQYIKARLEAIQKKSLFRNFDVEKVYSEWLAFLDKVLNPAGTAGKYTGLQSTVIVFIQTTGPSKLMDLLNNEFKRINKNPDEGLSDDDAETPTAPPAPPPSSTRVIRGAGSSSSGSGGTPTSRGPTS